MIDVVSFRTCPRFYPYPPYLSVLETFDENLMSYADDKIKQRLFQQSRGRNYKTNDPIWPVFELIRDFIHIHLIAKFQKHLIKIEGLMVMTITFPLCLWALVVAIANNVFIGFP